MNRNITINWENRIIFSETPFLITLRIGSLPGHSPSPRDLYPVPTAMYSQLEHTQSGRSNAAQVRPPGSSGGASLPAVPVLQQSREEAQAEPLSQLQSILPLQRFAPGVSPPPGTPPVQRATRIVADTYDGTELEMRRAFIGRVQWIMQQNHYSVTKNLLSACHESLAGDGVLNGKEFDTEEAFVDFVADQGLASSQISMRGVTHRPHALGKRPNFEAVINELRQRSEGGGEGSASRHVIPSHLLGYAAENLPESDDALDAWIAEFSEGVSLDVGHSRRVKKRNIWKILHNYKGNLWAGNSLANSAIGFLSGTVQHAVNEIAASPDPLSVANAMPIPEDDRTPLGSKMKEIALAVRGAFVAIVTESMGDPSAQLFLKDSLTEVWEQIEGDVFSMDLGEYRRASALIAGLQSSPNLALLGDFMTHAFAGTYGA
jgi:hypothetical protein